MFGAREQATIPWDPWPAVGRGSARRDAGRPRAVRPARGATPRKAVPASSIEQSRDRLALRGARWQAFGSRFPERTAPSGSLETARDPSFRSASRWHQTRCPTVSLSSWEASLEPAARSRRTDPGATWTSTCVSVALPATCFAELEAGHGASSRGCPPCRAQAVASGTERTTLRGSPSPNPEAHCRNMFPSLATRTLRWALLVPALACNRPGPTSHGSVAISSLDFKDDGRQAIVTIQIANDTPSPVYVYAEPMQVHYDDATRALDVVMHAVPTRPSGIIDVDCTVNQPSIRLVAAGTNNRLEVRLGRVEHVFPSASATASLPISQALRVDVALGWSTKRLRLASTSDKCREQAEGELQALEDGIARGRWVAND